jgi:hypothetical protein
MTEMQSSAANQAASTGEAVRMDQAVNALRERRQTQAATPAEQQVREPQQAPHQPQPKPQEQAPQEQHTAPDPVEHEAPDYNAEEEFIDTDEQYQEAETEDQEEQKYEVIIDGQSETVTLEELRKGYSRERDYHRKTEKLSQEKRELIGKVEEVQKAYGQQLANVTAFLEQQFIGQRDGIDWERLRHEDPNEYLLQKEILRERQESLVGFYKSREQEAAVEWQKQVKASEEALKDKLPEYFDNNSKLQEKMESYLGEIGFSKQEVGKLADYRMILVLNEALKYRELKAQKENASKALQQKKSVPVPKFQRPGPSGSGKASQLQTLSQKQRKAPSLENAVALLRARRANKS